MNRPICGTCKHWTPFQLQQNTLTSEYQGKCHGAPRQSDQWPTLYAFESCGMWKRIKDPAKLPDS